MEGKLKILETNKKSEEIISFYLIFRAFDHFYCDVVKRKCPCLGFTKMRNPGIGTVLHWRPPDVHIFHTDPSLVNTKLGPILTKTNVINLMTKIRLRLGMLVNTTPGFC